MKKTTQSHIIIKLLESSDPQKTLKEARGRTEGWGTHDLDRNKGKVDSTFLVGNKAS